MRKFCLKIIFVISICFCIYGVFALFILKHRTNNFCCQKSAYTDVGLLQSVKHLYKEKKIIFLGSSKVQSAILGNSENKQILNLSGYGQNPESNWVVLRNATTETLPANVVLELNWFSFDTKRLYLSNDIIGTLDGTDFFDDHALLMKMITTKSHDFFSISRVTPIHFHNNLTEKNVDNQKMSANAIESFYKTFPDGRAICNNTQFLYFLKIVDLCKINKVPLYVFTAPETAAYVELQKNSAYILSSIKTACQRNGVPYVDCRRWNNQNSGMPFKMNDSHHMNHSEATQFTRQLLNYFGILLSDQKR